MSDDGRCNSLAGTHARRSEFHVSVGVILVGAPTPSVLTSRDRHPRLSSSLFSARAARYSL